ncbi:MAG: GNAT family N-acetyltransferase [Paludibacter sp.]|nr:GNAT family N-acetyltransferase [Paludibacter sp.]
MVRILQGNEIDRKDWEHLGKTSKFGSFFQSPTCYDFYQKLSFLIPFVYAAVQNNTLQALVCGYIVADGGAAKRCFSRRAIIPGGILLSEDIAVETLQTLLEKLKSELRQKVIYVEFRNYHDYFQYKSSFIAAGFSYKQHYDIHNVVGNVENVWQGLSSSKKRQIFQSRKNGYTTVLAQSEEELKLFYALLSVLYTQKIGKPLFPHEFFEKIIREPFAKLFLVKKESNVVGGILTVEFQKKAVYEWFIAGDDMIKGIFPSALATWAGIEYAAQHNFEYFDFMGAGSDVENQGVREFKLKFGGKLIETGRFVLVNKLLIFNIAKVYLKMLNIVK